MIPATALAYLNALEAAMPKKPTPVLKGTRIPTHRLDTKTGKLEPIKKKLSPNVEYARKTKRKWRAAT